MTCGDATGHDIIQISPDYIAYFIVLLRCGIAADDPIVHTPGGGPADIIHYWSYIVQRKTEALGENPIQMSLCQTLSPPRLP
jgi:hypothetical protein